MEPERGWAKHRRRDQGSTIGPNAIRAGSADRQPVELIDDPQSVADPGRSGFNSLPPVTVAFLSSITDPDLTDEQALRAVKVTVAQETDGWKRIDVSTVRTTRTGLQCPIGSPHEQRLGH